MIDLSNSTYYATPFPHLVIDDFLTNPEELAQNFFSAPYQPGFKTSMSAEFGNLVNHITSTDMPNPTVDLSFDNDEFFYRSYACNDNSLTFGPDRMGPSKHYMLKVCVTASGENTGGGGGTVLSLSGSSDEKEYALKSNQAILWHCDKAHFTATKGYKGNPKEIHYPFINTCSFAWGPQAPSMPQPC